MGCCLDMLDTETADEAVGTAGTAGMGGMGGMGRSEQTAGSKHEPRPAAPTITNRNFACTATST